MDQNIFESLKFLSPPLTEAIRLSGTSRVTLVAKVDQENANINVVIVDYGLNTVVKYNQRLSAKDCWGESAGQDSACYYKRQNATEEKDRKIVSYGVLSAKHWKSLEETNYLTPGEWYSFEFDIFSTDHIFKEGHQIGIVIHNNYIFNKVPLTVTVDLAKTKITIPLVDKSDS
jgi:X-Pro dipeptidyl-peptidase